MATTARRSAVALSTLAALLLLGAIVGAVAASGPPAPPPARADPAIAWAAGGLLVLALAWVVIGALAARTRVVGKPGAAAARATWLAATRPWRARESTLGMLPLDRWLLLLVPGALLVATRALQTRFAGLLHIVVVLSAWVAFAIVARVLLGRRSPFPLLAAVGGVLVFRCILVLAALVFAPGGGWFAWWGRPLGRGSFIAVAVALFLWMIVAAGWALAAQIGGRRAIGVVAAGLGAAVAIPAAAVAVLGPGDVLAAWNAHVGLIPWGVARMRDAAASAGAIEALAISTAVGGVVLAVLGATLALSRRTERAPAIH